MEGERETDRLMYLPGIFHIRGKMLRGEIYYSSRLGRLPLRPAALARKKLLGPLEANFPLFSPSSRPYAGRVKKSKRKPKVEKRENS